MMRPKNSAMRFAFAFALALGWTGGLPAQDGGHGGPSPLTDVVAEAQNNNTQIAAAEHSWRAVAAEFAARGVPFSEPPLALSNAGSSSLGVPRLSQEVALREAETQRAQIEVFRSEITDQVKTIYFRLAYLYQMYELDDRGTDGLAMLIQTELSRYGQGVGSQSEVLQAQLERTKLLRETTKHHEEVGGLQAELKGLLHRAPDSPDVIPEPISSTKLKESVSNLLARAEDHNPKLLADRAIIDTHSARVAAEKQGVELDSMPGFMLRQAGIDEPDNFLLLFDRNAPHRAHADAPATPAAERLESARAEASEDRLRELAEIEKQYTFVTSSEELMRECKDGLIPQSRAVYDSRLAAYQSAHESFGAVIQAFLDQIVFEDDYLQALVEHETSLAHLEALTGEKLR